MANSSSFFYVTNPSPDAQPALYEALVQATATLNAVLAEYAVYVDTWNSSMVIDWSLAMTHRLTLLGPTTTFELTGARDGQKLVLDLKQDATGNRTITLPSNVRYSSLVPSVTLSAGANKIDKLGFIYNATDNKYDLVAVCYGT